MTMRVLVPYVLFETKAGKFGVDAYFSPRVGKVERRATLIRRAGDLTPVQERPEVAILTEESLGDYLRSLFEAVYRLSGESFNERASHMRRWSIWRILGIPTGHQRHIEKDEELARKNREALLALSILRGVLGVKKPEELDENGIKPFGYGAFELVVENGSVTDPVYRELFKVDFQAAMALPWLVIKGEKIRT